jgi:outer membrane protein assembly factor BamB
VGGSRLTLVLALFAIGCGGTERLVSHEQAEPTIAVQPQPPAVVHAPPTAPGCAPSTDPCLQTQLIGGRCVTAPRDGAACESSSPRAPGVCRAGRCESTGNALAPAWTTSPPANQTFVATAAEPGGPLAAITWSQGQGDAILATLQLLDVRGEVTASVPLPRTGPGDYAPNVLHVVGGRVYASATALRAFDADGTLRWTHDLRFDLASFNEPTPTTTAWFQTVQLLDDGAGHLVVLASGVVGTMANSWVFELDRESGATLRLLGATHDGAGLAIAVAAPGRTVVLFPNRGAGPSVLRCFLGDGSAAWSTNLPAHAEAPTVYRDQIWVGDAVLPGPGGISVLDAMTGTLLSRTAVEPQASGAPFGFRLGDRGLTTGAAGCLSGSGCQRGNAHQAAPVATYVFAQTTGKLEREIDGTGYAGAWVTQRQTLLAEDTRFEAGALRTHLLEVNAEGVVVNDCAMPDGATQSIWTGGGQIAVHTPTALHGYRVPGLTPQ